MFVNAQVVGGVLKIRLDGKFTFDDHKVFRQAYKDKLGFIGRLIEIDFANVDYLDSSALGMLLLVREMADDCGKVIELVNCRGVVAQILEVANFKRLFTIR